MNDRLPVRLELGPNEPLDTWLERLADANAISTGQLTSLLQVDGGVTRYLAVQPAPRTVSSISALTAQAPSSIRAATLARYDGHGALDLTGLDVCDWSTWRRVAARGWIHATGSAACPRCLAEDQTWRLSWRLPTVTVCSRHRCYLLERCPGCGRRFLDHPHAPLRSSGGTVCANPTGHQSACTLDIAHLATTPAATACLARQHRHDAALEHRRAINVLGTLSPAYDYLRDVRHLAVLLLHLASQPAAPVITLWAEELRNDLAGARTRWHLSAPHDPVVRSGVLVTADHILTAPDPATAADRLAPWIQALPPGNESRLGWLADHTTMTPTLTQLIMTALAPHQRISHALANTARPLAAAHIPQAIPPCLYARHALADLGEGGETLRLFLSLCLARRAGATTWADAAGMLGLEPAMGTRTARTISAHHRLSPGTLLAVLDAIGAELRIDYRRREHAVRRLTDRRDWYEHWCRRHRPGTRPTSRPYAVSWLWCHTAGGLLATSPAWPRPPTRATRALYRQFARSLSPQAAQALADCTRALEQGEP